MDGVRKAGNLPAHVSETRENLRKRIFLNLTKDKQEEIKLGTYVPSYNQSSGRADAKLEVLKKSFFNLFNKGNPKKIMVPLPPYFE